MVWQGREIARAAIVMAARSLVGAGLCGFDVKGEVMANVEVEVAIAVKVGPRRGRRPVAVAPQAGAIGQLFELAVPAIMQEAHPPPTRDEEIRPAVVVVVAHGHPVSVASGCPRDSCTLADIFKRAVPPIAEQAVARFSVPCPAGTLPLAPRRYQANRRRRNRVSQFRHSSSPAAA